MKTSTLLLLAALGMGQAWGQASDLSKVQGPIRFCAENDFGAWRWLAEHNSKRIPIRLQARDKYKCLDALWPYAAQEPAHLIAFTPDAEQVVPAPEQPIDVPAIQETRPIDKDNFRPCGTGWWITSSYGKEGRWCSRTTCADKTRILEHDEQDPPKYYCRRPQL